MPCCSLIAAVTALVSMNAPAAPTAVIARPMPRAFFAKSSTAPPARLSAASASFESPLTTIRTSFATVGFSYAYECERSKQQVCVLFHKRGRQAAVPLADAVDQFRLHELGGFRHELAIGSDASTDCLPLLDGETKGAATEPTCPAHSVTSRIRKSTGTAASPSADTGIGWPSLSSRFQSRTTSATNMARNGSQSWLSAVLRASMNTRIGTDSRTVTSAPF